MKWHPDSFLSSFCFPLLYSLNCEPGYLIRYTDSLRGGRFVDRIPVGARFSATAQSGPGPYPAYCTVGPGVPSPQGKTTRVRAALIAGAVVAVIRNAGDF
jgi:hypothetical protein